MESRKKSLFSAELKNINIINLNDQISKMNKLAADLVALKEILAPLPSKLDKLENMSFWKIETKKESYINIKKINIKKDSITKDKEKDNIITIPGLIDKLNTQVEKFKEALAGITDAKNALSPKEAIEHFSNHPEEAKKIEKKIKEDNDDIKEQILEVLPILQDIKTILKSSMIDFEKKLTEKYDLSHGLKKDLHHLRDEINSLITTEIPNITDTSDVILTAKNIEEVILTIKGLLSEEKTASSKFFPDLIKEKEEEKNLSPRSSPRQSKK